MNLFCRMIGELIIFYTFFFFNDTATTEIYTLSLHDALPISARVPHGPGGGARRRGRRRHHLAPGPGPDRRRGADRKSTRLNSSHSQISYAVFCLKKKNNHNMKIITLYNTDPKVTNNQFNRPS